MNPRLVSQRVPYIPIAVHLREKTGNLEALLDTGVEGEIIVPLSFVAHAGQVDQVRVYRMADGSLVVCDAYVGLIDLGPLGAITTEVVALGDECLMGRRLADRFRIILDHGRQLIVEP